MKNVFVMTMTQDQQLGYALDSAWYGTGEFTETMREAMSKLTVSEVNQAVRRHLSARDLSVVMVTPDGAALREQLLSSEPATIVYDAPKPQENHRRGPGRRRAESRRHSRGRTRDIRRKRVRELNAKSTG